jgi:hypothetical protein
MMIMTMAVDGNIANANDYDDDDDHKIIDRCECRCNFHNWWCYPAASIDAVTVVVADDVTVDAGIAPAVAAAAATATSIDDVVIVAIVAAASPNDYDDNDDNACDDDDDDDAI